MELDIEKDHKPVQNLKWDSAGEVAQVYVGGGIEARGQAWSSGARNVVLEKLQGDWLAL